MTLLLVLLQVVLVLAVVSVTAALVVAAVLAVNGRLDGREVLQIALGEDGVGPRVVVGAPGTPPAEAPDGVQGLRERLQRPRG